MSKLYGVDSFCYVMAESADAAEEWVSTRVPDGCTVTSWPSDMMPLEAEWIDAIPFNADDNRTCGQVQSGK